MNQSVWLCCHRLSCKLILIDDLNEIFIYFNFLRTSWKYKILLSATKDMSCNFALFMIDSFLNLIISFAQIDLSIRSKDHYRFASNWYVFDFCFEVFKHFYFWNLIVSLISNSRIRWVPACWIQISIWVVKHAHFIATFDLFYGERSEIWHFQGDERTWNLIIDPKLSSIVQSKRVDLLIWSKTMSMSSPSWYWYDFLP